MESEAEFRSRSVDARVFMLVHDSIVVLVKDEDIDAAKEILKRNTQKDRGCGIKGHPIGVDQDVGKDYSFGKFDKTYKLDGNSLSRIQDRV